MAQPAARIVKTLGENPGTVAWSLTQGMAFLHTHEEKARGWSSWCLDKSGLGAMPSAMFSTGSMT